MPTDSFASPTPGCSSAGSSTNERPQELSEGKTYNYYTATIFRKGKNLASPISVNAFLGDKKIDLFSINNNVLKSNGEVVSTLTKSQEEWVGSCDVDMSFFETGYGRQKVLGFRVVELFNPDNKDDVVRSLLFMYQRTNT